MRTGSEVLGSGRWQGEKRSSIFNMLNFKCLKNITAFGGKYGDGCERNHTGRPKINFLRTSIFKGYTE